jgi:DeoR family fructose operon transcriptional repressor
MAESKEGAASHTLFAEERHLQILQLLQEKTKLVVSDLCDVFSVSPATIRNDLRDLENKGKLKRTHGGAIPLEKAAFEPNTLAKCLADRRNLTILTNDVRIAMYLERSTQITIVLIGGILRHGFSATVGPIATSTLASFNVDKAFLGSNAFSIEKGFTTPDIHQAEVKKALIASASERIVVCDSSKFGRVSFVEFASISEIDRLITDNKASPKVASYLRDHKESLEFIVV